MTSERPLPPRPRRLAATGVAALLLLAACGDGQVTASGDEPPAPIEHPTGSEEIVVEVSEEGGFLPVGVALTQLPSLRVVGDGRAFTLGPQIAIFPAPALPNVVIGRVDVPALLAVAADAGLLDAPPEYGSPPVADVPTTRLVLVAQGRTVVHEALALHEDHPGLTADQRAARDRLSAFITEAYDRATGDERYVPDAFAVWAAPAPPAGGDDDDTGIVPQVVPWPLPGVALADAAGCVVVDGEAAATLRSTLADADQLTRYMQDDVVHEAWIRVLLPGDEGCPPYALPTR